MPTKSLAKMLASADGRAEVAKQCNELLPREIQERSFARRAARIFKDQFLFENMAGSPVTLPTFKLEGKFPLHARTDRDMELDFADAMGSMISSLAMKENEVLVNIAQASADAASAGATDGLVPYELTGTADYEHIFYKMQQVGGVVTHMIYHPVDYARVGRMSGLEWETRRDLLKLGVMGYYTSQAFGHNYRTTIMQSRVVTMGLPILLGARLEDDIRVKPNLYDLILTERVSPVLTIDDTKGIPVVTLTEEIGIGASGNFIQQVKLGEVKPVQY
jgi:hypothetical protein